MILWVYRGVKGQKTVQNDKKLCLSCSISQEPYVIWLSFMVQVCKMIISPVAFFNVKILIFQVVKGLKWQEMAQNDKNFCLLDLIISGTIYHMIFIYGAYVCIKGWYLQVFSSFFFFWFLGLLKEGREGEVGLGVG